MSEKDKEKYAKMREKDMETFNQHLELVKKHIVSKPLPANATAYRIFQDEHVRKAIEKDEDSSEAKKEASKLWKEMSAEDKREYNTKKKEHTEWMENIQKGNVNAYALFAKDHMEKAREENKTSSIQECAAAWKKAKQSVKDKFIKYAEELKEDKEKARDIIELATGVKPRRPLGAFNFWLMEAAKEGKLEGKNPFSDGRKMWNKLSEKEKEKYQKVSHRSKLAYMYKLMEYKATVKKTAVRAKSALNFFMADMKGKVPSDKIGKGGYFDYVYKRWNKMEEAAKKKYIKQAEESKKEAEKAREIASQRVFDKPKRPGNPMNFFIKENYERVKEKNKNADNSDVFKACIEEWNGLSTKEKEKYNKKYEANKEIYKSQLKDFEDGGFYSKDKSAKKRSSRSSSNKKSRSTSKKKGKKMTSEEE